MLAPVRSARRPRRQARSGPTGPTSPRSPAGRSPAAKRQKRKAKARRKANENARRKANETAARLRRRGPAPASSLFFFQAEDGIRDATVTGVKTCALPIFAATGGALPFGLGGQALSGEA